jgi:iron complex outermembrane receptor protein
MDIKWANPSPFLRAIPITLALIVFPMTAHAQESSAETAAEQSPSDDLLDLLADVGPAAPAGAESNQSIGPVANEPAGASADPASGSASTSSEGISEPSAEKIAPSELDTIPVPQSSDVPEESRAPPQGRQLEEIVVTAQKREQVSQDVPISMSVISDVFIQEKGITDVKDALLFVPNFKVIEFANVVTPQCRGFTVNEANPAFEPPCGFALDGVAFARAAYFTSGLFDLKRMEVLRGPQGTTFGKNTTAGLISLVSKDPSDDLSINLDLQHGLDGPGQRRAELGVGGALIPGVVNFRIAGMREDREGFMENTYHEIDPSVPKDSGGRDRSTYRIKLAFPDVFGTELKLLHERSDLSSLGLTNKAVAEEGSAYALFLRSYDPNIDFGENYKHSTLFSEAQTIITRQQLEWTADVGDWGVTLVAANGELKQRNELAPSPYPVAFARSVREEESPFATVELRTTSPEFDGLFGLESLFGLDLGSSNMLTGVFAQQQEIGRLFNRTDLYYLGLVGTITAASGVPLPIGQIEQLIRTLYGDALGEWYESEFSQKAKTAALFGQFTWNMTERWSIDLGARLSKETKEAHWDTGYSTLAPIFNTTGDRAFTADREISTDNFQPKISLGYKVTEDINLFAHWARAFKSGGFNFYTIAGNPEQPNPTNPASTGGSLSYGDETATEWGFDAKMRLFDNTMQLNISLFRLDVDDFQVLTDVRGTGIGNGVALPNGYQEVVNAAQARSQGVEADMTWLAADWLTIIAALGYNDTEYLSFPDDNCTTTEAENGEDNPETGRCDRTGNEFLQTPNFGGTLTLDTRFPLGGLWNALSDYQFLLGATAEYVGSSFSPNYDATSEQDSYYRYRAHTGFTNLSQGWTFRVTALNLTDAYIAQRSSDANLTTITPQPPRTIFAQFSWNY